MLESKDKSYASIILRSLDIRHEIVKDAGKPYGYVVVKLFYDDFHPTYEHFNSALGDLILDGGNRANKAYYVTTLYLKGLVYEKYYDDLESAIAHLELHRLNWQQWLREKGYWKD